MVFIVVFREWSIINLVSNRGRLSVRLIARLRIVDIRSSRYARANIYTHVVINN